MRTLDLVEILKSPPDKIRADGSALLWLPAPLNGGQLMRVPAGTWYRVHTADWAAQYGVTTAGTEHAEGDAAP